VTNERRSRAAREQARRREDTKRAAYAMAYLRFLAGERDTTPDPTYWQVTPEQAGRTRARVRALVAEAATAVDRSDDDPEQLARRMPGGLPTDDETVLDLLRALGLALGGREGVADLLRRNGHDEDAIRGLLDLQATHDEQGMHGA
jgi:hypothetical protein